MFSRSPSSSSSERSLPMSPPTRGRGSTSMKSPQVIQASPKTKPSPARTAAARKAAVAAARYDLWQLQSALDNRTEASSCCFTKNLDIVRFPLFWPKTLILTTPWAKFLDFRVHMVGKSSKRHVLKSRNLPEI